MSETLNESSEKSEVLFQASDIAEILNILGEEFCFDDETCQEIANMSFEEAVEVAYGYLVQAGFDPEEVLVDYIEDIDELHEVPDLD